ncbi:hypothetical protein ABS767_15725 [Sphingomonas sp. ST-64]|uniref:Uncharacterized protein n=1 Tax=Sphingomonas plantiphila TaxID=3163295 RepID=A0ABW8YQW7_9SPHN
MPMRNDRPFPALDRRCRTALLAVLALGWLPVSAMAQEQPQAAPADVAGDYVHSEMELVAGIRLNPDGSFQYGLTVGSLDERAEGRWTRSGDRIALTSVPRPVAPTITPAAIAAAPGQPFALRVVTPGGRDVPGVDLRIEFDSGEAIDSYLAGGPWTLPADERRTPRFVTFAMRAYRVRSERLPLDARAGTVATFLLTPNDFGVVDLTGAEAVIAGDRLTLIRPDGEMTFTRRDPAANRDE